jgi:hypothetical protein
MGGKGSGRRSHRPTLEEADVLELSIAFLRAKGMKAGRVGSIDYEDPEARFYAEIRYDLQSMPGTLRVSHLTRHSNPRERRLVEYTIDVSCVPSNLGAGELYLLHCPARPEIRATRLILPSKVLASSVRKSTATPIPLRGPERPNDWSSRPGSSFKSWVALGTGASR